MSLTAAALKKMRDMGLSIEQAIELAEVMEEGFAQPVPSYSDALERKRARDAERMRIKREQERQSRDVASDTSDTPSSPPSFPPEPPQLPTPTPECVSTRVKGPAFAKPNGFARFWEAYPNKVGKRAAEPAYAAALKRIEGPDPPGVILAGVERAKASRKWLEGIIPNPATWLNQDRWEDQPSEHQPGPRQANVQRPHNDARQAAREQDLESHHAGAMAALNRRLNVVG